MILAIDPGKGGALAWVSRDGHLIEVADMPVVKVRDRDRISAQQVADLMARRDISAVVIEGVGAMPGGGQRKMGATSAFNFGYGAGLLEGCAAALGLPLAIFSASTWKGRAGVPTDKGGARQMASRIWPGAADQFRRVRDDGRAEAALLGRWAVLERKV